MPGLFLVHLGIAHRQMRTIWRRDVFSLPNTSYEIVEGIGVHVCPPSVVLSKREEFLPCHQSPNRACWKQSRER